MIFLHLNKDFFLGNKNILKGFRTVKQQRSFQDEEKCHSHRVIRNESFKPCV